MATLPNSKSPVELEVSREGVPVSSENGWELIIPGPWKATLTVKGDLEEIEQRGSAFTVAVFNLSVDELNGFLDFCEQVAKYKGRFTNGS